MNRTGREHRSRLDPFATLLGLGATLHELAVREIGDGQPGGYESLRAACFIRRSGIRGAGARSAPPLKPASHSWYFQLGAVDDRRADGGAGQDRRVGRASRRDLPP